MFRNDSPFFSGVRTIVQKMHSLSAERLALLGLNRFEMMALLKIYEENGILQRDIVSEAGGEGVSIGLAVRALVRMGYIRREPDKNDRRMRRLFIAELGMERRSELLELKRSVEHFIIFGIENEELIALERIISKIEDWISCNERECCTGGRKC